MQEQIDRIVRPAEAEHLTGYCDVHLRRLEARGEFPQRFKLSDNGGPYGAAGWLLSDITAWLKARAATRSSVPAVDQPDGSDRQSLDPRADTQHQPPHARIHNQDARARDPGRRQLRPPDDDGSEAT